MTIVVFIFGEPATTNSFNTKISHSGGLKIPKKIQQKSPEEVYRQNNFHRIQSCLMDQVCYGNHVFKCNKQKHSILFNMT